MDIVDRFDVEEQIGSGGMATVWRATDRELRRKVVIKRLHPHLVGEREASERFKREALAAASLSHPGVVQVFDAGEDAQGPYIVMEYLDGETLGDLVEREGRLAPKRAAEIGARVAEALDHAHQHQLIHRDVKPNNILIDASGQAKLADFGIAWSMEATHGLTGTGSLMGTVGYLAPERASGREATPSSDIYSLGVVLYQMLTGVVPFSGDSPVAVAVAHMNSPPEPPSRLAPIPDDLEAIVVRAMAKDPADRLASAGEMAEALADWLERAASGQATEVLPGPTLDTIGSSLSQADIIDTGAQVADELAELHARGVVFSAVGPDNILISPDRARLADLGDTEETRNLTTASAYLAPEVVAGGAVSAKSEVFALAAVLYDQLAAEALFERTGPVADPPPLDDRQMDTVLRDALSPDPTDRPDAATFAARLRATAPTRTLTAVGGPTVELEPSGRGEGPDRPTGWWRVWSIAAAGVLLAGLVGYALGVGDDETPLNEATSTSAATTTEATVQDETDSVSSARDDLEAALAGAHPSTLKPKEARDLMEKVDRAIALMEESKPDEAVKTLREVEEKIDEKLDGDTKEDAEDALDRLTTALGVSLDEDDD